MKVLITGCNGLVGSALVDRFCGAGWTVHGWDTNARREFFGAAGSTAWVGEQLEDAHDDFLLANVDVRDARAISAAITADHVGRLDAVVHCAAQPSHDWAAEHPIEDFHVNALGTLNVLEACRQHCPEAVFVFMSTNKVYGAALGGYLIAEHATRFDFDFDLMGQDEEEGINEDCSVDQTMRSLYGAGKLAADVYVQEYGRYYGMRTVCLRAGCITGAGHAAVPAHGFLSYLVKCNVYDDGYVIKGYKGKQVRDNLHAADLARLIEVIVQDPPEPGTVYNVGGGKPNSCSILEALDAVEAITAHKAFVSYDPEPRRGDHACYYTDLRKVMRDYPGWRVERDLLSIYAELVEDWKGRLT